MRTLATGYPGEAPAGFTECPLRSRCIPDQLQSQYHCEDQRSTACPPCASTPLTRWKQPSASTSVVSSAPNDETQAAQNAGYSAYLRRFERADERTRTAYPCSLRVIGQALQGFAEACKSQE